MQEYWVRIERRLESLGCLNAMGLRPGAGEQEIQGMERHLGVALPASVKKILAFHDGQAGFGLIYGQQMLSVADIRQQWDNWRSIDEVEMNADCAEFMRSEPEGKVKPMYCNRAWIPLTHDGGGNHIGLDFDPGDLGMPGQVILFGRDEDTKRVVASSYTNFLNMYVAGLEQATWNGEYLETPADF